MGGRLVLIDGNNLVHRAYHALPELTTSGGLPVGAVYGFALTVLKLLQEHPPDYAAVAFDVPGKTFRHDQLPQYKANRPPTPPDLAQQFGIAREFADACGLRGVELAGYEADDVIGTLTAEAVKAGLEVLIVSIDRDCLQLIGDHVKVLSPSRGPLDEVIFDRDEVKRKYGYDPSQVADAKSLVGDPSDNIPGVPGVGAKTAAALLEQYGSVEGVLQHHEEIKKKDIREYLEARAEDVLLAKQLATIDTSVPVEVKLEGLRWPGLNLDHLRAVLLQLEFNTLLDRLPRSETTPSMEGHQVLSSPEEVVAWCQTLAGQREIGVCSLTHKGVWQGVALARGDRARFVPAELLAAPESEGGLFRSATPSEDRAKAREAVERLLRDPRVIKSGGGLKRQAAELLAVGIGLVGFGFDPELASYVLEPHRYSHTVQTIASERLQVRLPSVVADGQPQPEATCAWADMALGLEGPMRQALRDAELEKLFDEVEVPLTGVLLDMERAGVAVDIPQLRGLSTQMSERLGQLEREIHGLAAGPFNIESPKQLAEVLFVRLGLPVQKRTKTGPSTDAEVLEKLREQHPIIDFISEYRSFAKLKSTYVDSLADLAERSGGRVHTTFEQTVAATGRLSSRDPNLQNIPIRTEWGAKIRACFIASAPDLRLLSADYSQIELRLLAHFSRDPHLREAFQAGEDIHRHTAEEIFDVPAEAVTPEMRRQAKTVNFAVIYGMGPVSLAHEIGVTRQQAAEFIERYFAKLTGVRRYLTETLEQARAQGYVTTLMGRRRAVPELQSASARERSYGERAAANSPLQGTAADIIKVAMVQLHRLLGERRLRCRMLLQVHDELLFEVPVEELGEMAVLAKEVMEGACRLNVPLVVDVSVGENWRDLSPVSPSTV